MLLLYLVPEHRYSPVIEIYIPLCLYFIADLLHRICIWCQFTFHYASTLSTLMCTVSGGIVYLHSTMLLLYRLNRHHIKEVIIIYIPLCFYFIALPRSYRHRDHPNLHSTMLLLYHDRTAVLNVKKHNLHSTMLLLYQIAQMQIQAQVQDLHSTMLLLYPCPRTSLPSSNQDLHSTMLLLYPIQWSSLGGTNLFTFHYASTLSEQASVGRMESILIYIPLCFYFIFLLALSGLPPFTFTFHYASTLSEIGWY